MVVVTVVLLMAVAYTVLLERKVVGAHPEPLGALAASAPSACCSRSPTALKLFLKEDIMPTWRLSAALHPRADHCADLRADSRSRWCRSAPDIQLSTASICSRSPTSTSACW